MKKIIGCMFVLLIGFTLFLAPAYADWAKSFVVFDGGSYAISDIELEASQVGPVIGKVTKYSDSEGTYSGNFSNRFPKGTSYYKINDFPVGEAIAVGNGEGKWVKALYDGEYAGKGFSWKQALAYVFGGFLLLMVFLFLQNTLRQKDGK
ncbi:hypothetical protein [Paenibacillus luteus]|uniref:hypothetical protein n=1 Tax=Paenibacillus luteus TaxID=2545753 RepID=UPI001F50115F|nr:hypothetical protein [Paenibacillus luteus]